VQATNEQTLILHSTVYQCLGRRVDALFEERRSDQDIYLD
jgi:hypothetical protein